MNPQALLIIAHGSRLESSNQEIVHLKNRIDLLIPKKNTSRFSIVEAAFLELSFPSIPEGIDLCLEQGAKTIIIFPYFLAQGRHVKKDIPEIVNEKKRNHPEIEIRITDYFGLLPEIDQLIVKWLTHQTDKKLI